MGQTSRFEWGKRCVKFLCEIHFSQMTRSTIDNFEWPVGDYLAHEPRDLPEKANI